MVNANTIWEDSQMNEFVVLHVIEQEGHRWVHYRRNNRDHNEEYSCYEESFLLRFRQVTNQRGRYNQL